MAIARNKKVARGSGRLYKIW